MKSDFKGSQHGLLSIIAENSPDLLALLDVNGMVLYANATFEKLLGRPPELLLGSLIFDLIAPNDFDAFHTAYQSSMPDRAHFAIASKWLHHSGHTLAFDSIGSWICADDGK